MAKNDIENIFKVAFKEHQIEPSADLVKKIRFKLWLADFLSVRPNKFNVVYLLLLLGTTGVIYSYSSKTDTEELVVKETKRSGSESENLQIADQNTNISVPEEVSPESASITEETANSPLSAGFTLSETSGCAPLAVSFKNTSQNAEEFSWNLGDGSKTSLASFNHTYTKPGKFKVLLVASDKNGNSKTLEKWVTVHNSPLAEFDIDIEKSDIETRTIHFINNSKNSISYNWDFGDNESSEQQQATHQYKTTGIYPVKLTVFSSMGCSDTALYINKFIEKDYRLLFPNSFRPNINAAANDGQYKKAENQSFVFYPENNGVLEYNLKIYTSTGNEIFQTDDIKIGWNGFVRGRIAPSGKYFYTAKGKYPNKKTFKIEGYVNVIVEDYNNYY
ncbi:MAG: PKD domain-containing protein [Bacteroidales bacterium]|nr:PKD domain-containing protein [Bacteroidales bacterium]MBN2818634.1 PKD domain-containing protein [Bacteroidales bacterium]